MKLRDMPYGTEFWYRYEWYVKTRDIRIDGVLHNCFTLNMSEPDYAPLDEDYMVRKQHITLNSSRYY